MSSDDEEKPVKVPGNVKGPMLKPDGSVPAAGKEWTDAKKKKWRVCTSGQACVAKHGRIHVYDVTSGAGNKTCHYCWEDAHGKSKRSNTGRNCCPCKEYGGGCTHGRGNKAAGYRCAKCRDGKCTPEYHASGNQQRVRQPPPR